MRGTKKAGASDDGGGSNVWRSYSDMTSGLLLLFVLIMAVCLMQAQKNYADKLSEQAKLIKSQTELEESHERMNDQQKTLATQEAKLKDQKADIEQKESELAGQKATLDEQAKTLESLLAELEGKEADLTKKQAEVESANETIAQRESELAASQEELDEAMDLVLAGQAALEESKAKLDGANAVMTAQQEQIDRIVGMKAGLIQDIDEEFRKADVGVQIDPQTGAMILDSNVLYEFGKSDLTDAGKEILDAVLPIYCSTLLDESRADDVGEIIVDGYTDSVGDYVSNLKLSQERAFQMAKYLLENVPEGMTEKQMETLRSKLSVNGKSSSAVVIGKDGKEDADASRRVEIKFRLKDEEMIAQLQELVDHGVGAAADAAIIEEGDLDALEAILKKKESAEGAAGQESPAGTAEGGAEEEAATE